MRSTRFVRTCCAFGSRHDGGSRRDRRADRSDIVTDDPLAALSRAIELHRAGRLADAEALYRGVLQTHPDHPDALHFLGMLRAQAGDVAEGIALLRRAIARQPGVAMYHSNLGKALASQKDWPAAVASYRRAVDLAPGDASAHLNLALALRAVEDLAGAEAAYRRALALDPNNARSHQQLGVVLAGLDRRREAEASFRAALRLQPDDPDTLFFLGRLCRERGALDEAESWLRRALAVQPEFAMAQAWLGDVRQARGDLDEADLWLRRAVERLPQDWSALVTLAQVRLGFADFRGAWDLANRAMAIAPAEPMPQRFALMAALYDPGLSRADRAAKHTAFGTAMAARVQRKLPAPPNDRDLQRPLRIGWLSSDFRQHPVARNLEQIFALRDTTRATFACYAEVAAPDDMTAWFRRHADLWRSTVGLSDAAVAEQIRADRIDVMIYLAGRFDHNRSQVAAWRPAPVQVSFHDPATSGLSEMDYLIADPVLAPRPPTETFTERVVRLPYFYTHRPLEPAPDVGPLPMRAAGHVRFASFNNPTKIGDPVLGLWGRILERLPAARLKIKYKGLTASTQVRERIAAGIGAAARRIDFDPVDRPVQDHLRLYNDVDVALDPFPFNGSTTTFEALWMGVPVVTLLGDTMVGRWSAAMLHALELDELIAHTSEEYVEIAVRLAVDSERLATLRAQLRERVAASPLCDGERYTRHFERLIRALWRRWCRAG